MVRNLRIGRGQRRIGEWEKATEAWEARKSMVLMFEE
jgi:hypothetical protein